MSLKPIAGLLLAASIAAGPATTAAADTLGGLIAGGIIGGLIVNEANKNKQRQRSTTTQRSTKSSAPSGQRTANREVQTALNYFAFPVGTPDGALGPKSRAAIAEYQAMLNFPPTGQLTQFERDILVGSYYRAQAGGPATMQQIANNPRGVRGLLVAYKDQMVGGAHGFASAGYGGLPPEVSQAVEEIARNSNVQVDQLVQRAGFIQLADLNEDGRTDYILDTSVTGSGFWCNAQSCAVRVFASTPEGYRRNDMQATNVTPASFDCQGGSCVKVDGQAPVPAAAPAPTQPPATMAAAPATPAPGAAAALPSFLGAPVVAASLTAHCNKVSLLTNTNGGYITAATMTDASFALSEQFCIARAASITQSDSLIAAIPGFTPDQIATQCAGFGPVLKEHVAALSIKDRDSVLQGVTAFALSTGMAPDQLTGTAQICLGVGYAKDDMDVAVGSALVLTALGTKGYAELAGHHLAQGFGASRRPDMALPWFEMSLEAAATGATVFGAGMADRPALIRKAAFTLGGKPERAEAPAAIPTFVAPAPAAAPAVTQAAASAPVAVETATAAPDSTERRGIEALPLAARLPFLLFKN